jgi:hypothetical protein
MSGNYFNVTADSSQAPSESTLTRPNPIQRNRGSVGSSTRRGREDPRLAKAMKSE